MQSVNTQSKEAILAGTYDVTTDLLDSPHSKIWQDISHLFIANSFYKLGLSSTGKAQAEYRVLKSVYVFKNGQMEDSTDHLEKGQGLFKTAMDKNANNREVIVGLLKSLVIAKLLGGELFERQEYDTLLKTFDLKFPYDGRNYLLHKATSSTEELESPFKANQESYVQFIRRAGLYFYFKPFNSSAI